MIHEYSMQIKEFHLDTFGHVNNATYLQIFEEARWDLITQNGFGLKQIVEKKVGPTILEINLRFMRELKNREKIKIQTRMLDYKGKIGTLEQKIINEKNEECTVIQMKIGLFDVRERKLISPTPEWAKAIGMEQA